MVGRDFPIRDWLRLVKYATGLESVRSNNFGSIRHKRTHATLVLHQRQLSDGSECHIVEVRLDPIPPLPDKLKKMSIGKRILAGQKTQTSDVVSMEHENLARQGG